MVEKYLFRVELFTERLKLLLKCLVVPDSIHILLDKIIFFFLFQDNPLKPSHHRQHVAGAKRNYLQCTCRIDKNTIFRDIKIEVLLIKEHNDLP